MSRLFFFVNYFSEFDFGALINRYLPGRIVDVGVSLPQSRAGNQPITFRSYRRIITEVPAERNVILFRSSNLPKGRGWVPIYHSIADGEAHYVISGIFAAPEVGAGEGIVKARFPIKPFPTAADLRYVDAELSIMLVAMILNRFQGRELRDAPQRGGPTLRRRHRQEDNRVDLKARLIDLVPHLRACRSGAPAFFELGGVRFNLSLEWVVPAPFPSEIEFVFAEDME